MWAERQYGGAFENDPTFFEGPLCIVDGLHVGLCSGHISHPVIRITRGRFYEQATLHLNGRKLSSSSEVRLVYVFTDFPPALFALLRLSPGTLAHCELLKRVATLAPVCGRQT